MRAHPGLFNLIIFCAALASGCRTETFDDADELDQIATVRQAGRSFDEFRTFALSDQVVDLSALSEDPIEIDHSLDPVLIQSIERNMVAAGYQRVPIDQAEQADLTLVAGAVVSNNWTWYGYYPCWYPYYCYWYPPVVVPVNIPVGGIVVLMLRLPEQMQDTSLPQPSVPVVWAAGLRGLAQAGSTDLPSRISAGVDQAFVQSPYLRSNEGEAL